MNIKFTQILSKGKLQAEEVRSQLGDRLPAAVNILANSLGVTTQELDGMMKRGELIASEVMPKFAKQLRIAAREGGALAAGMNTVTAAQSRMSTAWTIAIGEMMDAGGKQGVVDIFDTLKEVITDLTPAFKALGVALKYIGVTFKVIVVPIFKALNIVLNALWGGIKAIDDSLSSFFGNLKKKTAWLTELIDSFNTFLSIINKEKNFLDAAADIMIGTDRGKYLEQMYDKQMAAKGYKSFENSIKPQNKNNSVTINVTANGTDPAGVVKEIDRSYQGWLRAISTGAN